MKHPRISVLFPYRNAESTLGESLASVLAQQGPNFELLAVDDQSTDGGPEMLASLAQRDRRVQPLATTEASGIGIVAALTVAAAAARAPLLARMDADDISLPGRFAKQVDFLDAHPDVAVVGTSVENLADAEVGEGLARYVEWQNGVLTPDAHDRDLFIESPLCHPSVLMRRDAFEAVGGYRNPPWAEDYDLWLRYWEGGHRMAKLPEVLLSWRNLHGRLTHTDPRLSPEAFRTAKACFLAPWLRARDRPVTIWGAGKVGRRLARALEANGITTARFVDVDPKKIGKSARGAPIVPFSALRPGAETIVAAVGNRGARSAIREALDARGFVEGVDYRVAA